MHRFFFKRWSQVRTVMELNRMSEFSLHMSWPPSWRGWAWVRKLAPGPRCLVTAVWPWWVRPPQCCHRWDVSWSAIPACHGDRRAHMTSWLGKPQTAVTQDHVLLYHVTSGCPAHVRPGGSSVTSSHQHALLIPPWLTCLLPPLCLHLSCPCSV